MSHLISALLEELLLKEISGVMVPVGLHPTGLKDLQLPDQRQTWRQRLRHQWVIGRGYLMHLKQKGPRMTPCQVGQAGKGSHLGHSGERDATIQRGN